MQFTYTYLKNAEKNNIKLGHWQSKPVYAITKERIDEYDYDEDCAYVIYDWDNYLFYNERLYGNVKPAGDVVEFSSRVYQRRKTGFTEKKEEKKKEVEEYKSETIGDVELGIIVDKTLTDVRSMTIDDLLKGFNYGL